ncbi:MAG: M48 family metalloprotease [Acidobacteriota bacterium]|nr:M48 family metalloprotease [Acidobacteriota bacterium]
MSNSKWILAVFLTGVLGAVAQQNNPSIATNPAIAENVNAQAQPVSAQLAPVTTMDQVVERSILREHELIKMLSTRTPLVETYLQDLAPDQQLGAVPKSDHYFLGRMDLGESVGRHDYIAKNESLRKTLLGGVTKLFKLQYNPIGFSWMIFADREEFDRKHYDFRFIHREFLGDVRCLVFDVTPQKDAGNSRFLGRIWVEDENYNIVRLNGTYTPRPKNAYYFHMDSWRLNLIPGYWLPAYVYSEEGDFSSHSKDKLAFKAQTRIWGYDLQNGVKESELGQIHVDSVKDESAAVQDASPLQAERQWQQQAEDNVLERLQEAGLLAPAGQVDSILQTVVNNLQVTNNIDLPRPVRARVLLTSPLETFSVGNTIVISRGLIDVLPDEASLGAILSHELAHIVLGHNLGSKFAFNDRMLFNDESTYKNFGFRHNAEEETAADAKALLLLKNSPYAAKLDSASLFLKELGTSSPHLSALMTAHLGNKLADEKGNLTRLDSLAVSGPALNAAKLDQVTALPLGGRVKVNPWDDRVEMVKSAPVAITSARDKMPFEVTPFYPRLSRLTTADNTGTPTTAANTAPTK